MLNDSVFAPETVCTDAQFTAHGTATGIAFQADDKQALREELEEFRSRHCSRRNKQVVETRGHFAAKAAFAVAGRFAVGLRCRFEVVKCGIEHAIFDDLDALRDTTFGIEKELVFEHFALRIVPQRENVTCNLFALFSVKAGLPFLHRFSHERLAVHAKEPRRNAFRKDDRNLAAFDFLCTKKFRRVFCGTASNFFDRKLVPIAAIFHKISEFLDAVTASDCACAHGCTIRAGFVKKPRVVRYDRIIMLDVAAEVRNVLDFLRLCKRRFFKFDAEILHGRKVKRFKRRIVVRFAFREFYCTRERNVDFFGPLCMAESVLERLAESIVRQTFRMRITGTAILDNADTKAHGIRDFRVLHLSLKDGKPFGMRVRSDYIKLFGFALGEVAHKRNCIFNIHIAKSNF